MEKNGLDVIVVGGSLAGLMQGIALKRAGHNVRIFEQSQLDERQSQAAGIACGPAIQEFFKEYNIDVTSSQLTPHFLHIHDQNLKVLVKRPYPDLCTSWTVLYHVLRAHFDGFFSAACPQPVAPARAEDGKVSFELGKRVVDVIFNENGRNVVSYDDLGTGDRKEQEADLIIAADGANSKLRRNMLSFTTRPYSGYVAWRGSVPESDVSEAVLDLIGTTSNMFQLSEGTYLVVYLTPSDSGNIQNGSRNVNWLRYEVISQDTEEFREAMTDTSGQYHRNTLPIGEMQSSVWARQIERAKALHLAPQLIELMRKTKKPFITAVTDVEPPPRSDKLLYDHRIFFVGEAFSLLRPNVAVSSSQAAMHALNLTKVLNGEMSRDEFDTRARQFYEYNAAFNGFVRAQLMGTWGLIFRNECSNS